MRVFWDAQVKENAQLAESVTITGAEGQSNDFSSDTLIITPSDTNVKSFSLVKGLPKGEKENKPQTVHLYNIKEVPASSSKTTKKNKEPLQILL
jgi:hypothetical protein